MNRIFDVKIEKNTIECTLGYDVYYDSIRENSIAINVKTFTPSIEVPYGEFIVGSGLRVSVPNTAKEIILLDLCTGKINKFILEKLQSCFITTAQLTNVPECLY